MAKLTLDGGVNLQRLQQFAEQAGDKSIRLKTEDGVQVLYTSDKKSTGIKNLFTGQTDTRRAAAGVEIRRLLSEFQTTAGKTGAPIDGNILNQMPTGRTSGNTAATVIKSVRDDAIQTNEAKGMADLAVHAFRSNDPEALKKVGEGMTERMDAYAANSGDKNAFLTKLAASDGKPLKELVLKHMIALQPGLAKPGTTYDTASPELKRFLDDAFNQGVANLDGHRYLDAKGDHLEFAGEKYTRVKAGGGSGSFGTVDIYKKDGSEERIAIKRPLIKKTDTPEVREEKFNAYLQEYKAHARVGKGGDDNVVGLKGMMRGAQGEPLIVLDAAPYGDVYAALPKLHDSNASPKSKTTVALTLLHDMAKGLKKAHKEGVVHLDVKGPNFLIGKDGVAQLADMGTTDGEKVRRTEHGGKRVDGAKRMLTENPIDNAVWSAPELVAGGYKMKEMSKAVGEVVEARVAMVKSELEAQGIKGEDLDTILQDVKIHTEQKYKDMFGKREFEITEKADVWAFGMCAFQLLFGEELPAKFQSGFMSEIGKNLIDFADEADNRIFVAKQGEKLTDEQKFVNWVLHPDKNQRPTMAEVVNHPIFKKLGVGGDEAYNVIMKLGDANERDGAIQQLDAKVGT